MVSLVEDRAPQPVLMPPVTLRIVASPFTQWLDEARMVLGEKGFDIGTVRSWKDGDYIKTKDGWVKTVAPTKQDGKVLLGPGDTITKEDYLKNTQSSTDKIREMLGTGALPGTFEEQLGMANTVVKKHRARFAPFSADLQNAAPPGATVSGRVKTLQSVLGKLTVKPKYKNAEGLQDVTGMRIVCDNAKDVQSTVENLKKKFTVVAEDDYINHPLGAMHYRSHHLIVRDVEGTDKEVQVRTKRQDTFGHFAHEAYKPTTEAKRAAIEAHSKEIEAYAAAVSDHFAKLDNGEPSEEPVAPAVVRDTFGAIDTHS